MLQYEEQVVLFDGFLDRSLRDLLGDPSDPFAVLSLFADVLKYKHGVKHQDQQLKLQKTILFKVVWSLGISAVKEYWE